METPSEKLTAQQSLDLISNMIIEAQGNVQRNNFYFLLWGWVIVIANIGVFTLKKFDFEQPYLMWAITIPAWIFTLYKVVKDKKQAVSTSHFDRISGGVWMTFGISICILIVFGAKINFQLNPVILTITAIPTFISGVILRFKPLMAGGICFWIFAILAFLVDSQTQPLIGAIAIICGYLIPGYMLKIKNG